jgi:hypothetical protein
MSDITHSLVLHFGRILSEDEWRQVVVYSRDAPYVDTLEATATKGGNLLGTPYEQAVLRAFEKACREAGIQLQEWQRFYGYLQAALCDAAEEAERFKTIVRRPVGLTEPGEPDY